MHFVPEFFTFSQYFCERSVIGMSKQPRAYMIFLCLMVLVALLGVVLLVTGSANHVPLRQLFPGEWPMTRGLPL